MSPDEPLLTRFTILESNDGKIWKVLGAIDASSRDQAYKKSFPDGGKAGFQYNAVPERNWKPVQFATRTVMVAREVTGFEPVESESPEEPAAPAPTPPLPAGVEPAPVAA